MMRVVHVVPSLHPATGGPARSVPALCAALRQAGVEVELWTFGQPAVAEQDGLRLQRPLHGTRQFPTPDFYLRLRRSLRGTDLAHLHSLWNPAIGLAARACRRAGVPYLISPRGMLQARAVERRGRLKAVYCWLFERHTIRGARALHFLTETERRDSMRFTTSAHTLVIPNGTDPRLGATIEPGRFRKAWPRLEGRRVVLFLGRLDWSKGLDLQLEAMSLVVQNVPGAAWVLAGPDDGEWPRLSRAISRLGLEGSVFWTGPLPHEQALTALADADAVVLTSRHEAHSVAMNEALAVGVPLVLTDTVGFEAVAECEAGRVVPARPEAVAAAIAGILRDPDLAARMRRAGRRLAEQLSWPRIAEAMKTAYLEILGAGTWVADRRAPTRS